MVSPADHRLYGSLVCVDLQASAEKQQRLWEEAQRRKMWLLGGERLRLSAHIHTRPSDIATFFALSDEMLA